MLADSVAELEAVIEADSVAELEAVIEADSVADSVALSLAVDDAVIEAEFDAVLLGVSVLEGDTPMSRRQIHALFSVHSSMLVSALK